MLTQTLEQEAFVYFHMMLLRYLLYASIACFVDYDCTVSVDNASDVVIDLTVSAPVVLNTAEG